MYRDIDTFTDFAMTLSLEERGYVGVPYGLRMGVQLPKKLALDPTSKQIDPSFTPINYQPPNPRMMRLVGRLEQRGAQIKDSQVFGRPWSPYW